MSADTDRCGSGSAPCAGHPTAQFPSPRGGRGAGQEAGRGVPPADVRLLVADFPACYRFYAEVLGLKPQSGAAEGP
ncbi:hypothetical protein ABZ063_47740, partial [Streptomyces sp. NPDC006333]